MMFEITGCPALLQDGYTTYSPLALRQLFSGKKVSPYLAFAIEDEDDLSAISQSMEVLSISGAQEKYAAHIQGGKICLCTAGELTTHILKPAPMAKISYRKQIPANEHLTMQIARQVYGIVTADNGLCFSADNQVAYITRRYDITSEGTKLRQEDFCALLGRSEEIDGKDFKYQGSYEDMANIIKRYIPAWPVAMERFFRLVVFNYIYGNGDAHLKNFSVLYHEDGDVQLAPAYDLINTHLHLNDSDFAMRDGLSTTLEKSDAYVRTGHPCQDDFRRFGWLIGLSPKRVEAVLQPFMTFPDKVRQLIARSYFSDEKFRRSYSRIIEERHQRFVRME
jgi:serine/threonine-protein kinase HipA